MAAASAYQTHVIISLVPNTIDGTVIGIARIEMSARRWFNEKRSNFLWLGSRLMRSVRTFLGRPRHIRQNHYPRMSPLSI